MDKETLKKFMTEAIDLSLAGVKNDAGGPFGAIIVKDNVIIGRGHNRVTSTNDPTAHAEVVAIRNACNHLHSFQLDGCILFTSCEPCPMCLGAIYWSRLQKIYYGCNRNDAAAIGFDDEFIYTEIGKPITDRKIEMEQLCRADALQAFANWDNKSDKIKY